MSIFRPQKSLFVQFGCSFHDLEGNEFSDVVNVSCSSLQGQDLLDYIYFKHPFPEHQQLVEVTSVKII